MVDNFPGLSYRFDDHKFDRETWLKAEPSYEDIRRAQMTDDLIERILIPGMDILEVKDLLGEPTAKPTYPVKPGFRYLEYGLGNASGFRVDGDYLTIQFDMNGRLVQAWHWQS